MVDSQTFKLVMLGDGAVGKTALTRWYSESIFFNWYDPTIEEIYKTKRVIDGEVASLEILDTAGQEGFCAMRETHMTEAEGIMLVYSIIDRNSFNEIASLHKTILRVRAGNLPKMILVANKQDMSEKRAVTQSEGLGRAESFNIQCVETSAKTGHNVEKIFQDLVRSIRQARKPIQKNGCCQIL